MSFILYHNLYHVGEKVWQIERHPLIPTGSHKWSGTIIKVEPNYVEVKWNRVPTDWLEDLRREMKRGSSNNFDRTYFEQYTKNYFSPQGEINIEKFNNDTLMA